MLDPYLLIQKTKFDIPKIYNVGHPEQKYKELENSKVNLEQIKKIGIEIEE